MALAQIRAAAEAVTFAGNSLWGDSPDGGGGSTATRFQTAHPTIARYSLTVPGISWQTLLLNTREMGQSAKAGVVTVLAMLGGLADLTGGRTGAQIYADMVTYANAWGGTYVIGCTIPTSTDLTGPQETVRGTANSLIIADASDAFDTILDVAGLSLTFDDGTHFDSTTCQTVADALGVTYDALV